MMRAAAPSSPKPVRTLPSSVRANSGVPAPLLQVGDQLRALLARLRLRRILRFFDLEVFQGFRRGDDRACAAHRRDHVRPHVHLVTVDLDDRRRHPCERHAIAHGVARGAARRDRR
jgi:hypothetical protein